MTQEEKSLLLQDLCARLPYGVNVEIDGYNISVLKGIDGDTISTDRGINYPPRVVKPYLRPMGSMTEEEKEEYEDLDYLIRYATNSIYASERLLDFCNSHYLDYHGLIGRGLALEAPQGMYNKMEE